LRFGKHATFRLDEQSSIIVAAIAFEAKVRIKEL
jgi:hypothetical protein